MAATFVDALDIKRVVAEYKKTNGMWKPRTFGGLCLGTATLLSELQGDLWLLGGFQFPRHGP